MDMVDVLELLTPRQTLVYNELITPKTYAQIQRQLSLSSGGVRCHVNKVLEKTESSSRVDLLCDYYAQNDAYVLRDLDFIKTLDDLETSVFTFTINGYSIQETADALGMSRSTVRFARHRIYLKSQAEGVLDLVHKCYGVLQ